MEKPSPPRSDAQDPSGVILLADRYAAAGERQQRSGPVRPRHRAGPRLRQGLGRCRPGPPGARSPRRGDRRPLPGPLPGSRSGPCAQRPGNAVPRPWTDGGGPGRIRGGDQGGPRLVDALGQPWPRLRSAPGMPPAPWPRCTMRPPWRPDRPDAWQASAPPCGCCTGTVDAEAALRQALALDPQHLLAHANLGRALRAQNRLEEAAAAYHGGPRPAPGPCRDALEPRRHRFPARRLGRRLGRRRMALARARLPRPPARLRPAALAG